MENLNAEKVKKALECCGADDGCVGEECPYYVNCQFCITRISKDALALINSQEQRIGKLEKRLRYLLQSKTIAEYDEVDIHTKEYVKDIHSLDANIKELTEVNERLRTENERYAELEEGCFVTGYKNIKADTVREMQAEIEARCIKGGIYPAFVKSTIDQIAKELTDAE